LSPGNNFKRLFVAIPLTQEYISFLNSFREANKDLKNVRWTLPENLHITLCFIGKVAESKTEEIISVIDELTQKTNPFSLEFKENRYATDKRQPTMIWCEFQKNKDFVDLYNSLHKRPTEYLVKKESRKNPIPHITLARLKSFSKDQLIQDKELPGILTVNKIELWESKLNPAGSEYSMIKRFLLS
jgi:RNA 2',3'-cyclic 3'-phosphodiesterase